MGMYLRLSNVEGPCCPWGIELTGTGILIVPESIIRQLSRLKKRSASEKADGDDRPASSSETLAPGR
jgi:hypothetical protein